MKQKLILIIDDEPTVREVLTLLLKSWGYQTVIQAADGQEGIELVSQRRPDLVITDLTMPRMRGEQVLEWISRKHKPLYPAIRTIALSGDGAQAEAVVRAAGCDDFIHKPFGIDHLRATVEALLA